MKGVARLVVLTLDREEKYNTVYSKYTGGERGHDGAIKRYKVPDNCAHGARLDTR